MSCDVFGARRDGNNLVDFTHVSNVVHGHILAANCLGRRTDVSGEAFNVTNCEPVKFWWFLGQLLEGLDYPRPRFHLPYSLVYVLSLIMTFLCFLVRSCLRVNAQATFTPMQVALAGTYHFYDSSKAQSRLGYKPVINLDKGIRTTLETFQHLRNKKKA